MVRLYRGSVITFGAAEACADGDFTWEPQVIHQKFFLSQKKLTFGTNTHTSTVRFFSEVASRIDRARSKLSLEAHWWFCVKWPRAELPVEVRLTACLRAGARRQ